MRDWLARNLSNIAGGVGGGGLILLLFRDSLREWWQEWHASRRAARETLMAASGRDLQLARDFLGLLKTDIESNSKSRDEIVRALARLSETTAQIVTMQAALDRKVDALHGDVLTLKGAVLGRMQ